MRITASRYHDISAGHRVYQHESKCAHLHGHNYRIHFEVEAMSGAANHLDSIGRVIDFSVIKAQLCMWLEDNWDHKFLVWKDDPWAKMLCMLDEATVVVPFNPTAENMGAYLLFDVAPPLLAPLGVTLVKVIVEETRKCSCTVTNEDRNSYEN